MHKDCSLTIQANTSITNNTVEAYEGLDVRYEVLTLTTYFLYLTAFTFIA